MAAVLILDDDEPCSLGRILSLARGLLAAGCNPAIFAQATYPDSVEREVPGFSSRHRTTLSHDERAVFARDVQLFANRTDPSLVIAEPNSAGLLFESSFGEYAPRFCLVPPSDMDRLRWLNQRINSPRFLLAEVPNSPTWPYSDQETEELSRWSNWLHLGPLPEAILADPTELLLERYSLRHGDLFFLFILDVISPHATPSLLQAIVHSVARAITHILARHHQARLLLVSNPHLANTLSLNRNVEVIPRTEDLASLVAKAAGVAFIPTCDLISTCISTATPFLPLAVDFASHTSKRALARAHEADLVTHDIGTWLDDSWATDYAASCRSSTEKRLTQTSETVKSLTATSPQTYRLRAQSLTATGTPSKATDSWRRLLIRVDDVTSLSDEFLTICELCISRGLSLSLEIIPYLCRFDETTLRNQFRHTIRFEASQHGFAHLPRRSKGRKTEFVTASGVHTKLRTGVDTLKMLFPTTFKGGFSAPYDFYPDGLGNAWSDVGGSYISVVWSRHPTVLPIVRLTDDPWDWMTTRARPIRDIVANVERAFDANGYAGLVLHPQVLLEPGETQRHADLLDELLARGCASRLISEVIPR